MASCATFHSPPVISDISEDKIKVRLIYNLFETPESLQRRRNDMQQEAQRGCSLYGETKRAVSISAVCVRYYDATGGGSCKEEEFLFACAN